MNTICLARAGKSVHIRQNWKVIMAIMSYGNIYGIMSLFNQTYYEY